MRTSSLTTSNRLIDQLTRLSDRQIALQNRIATGQRVTSPGDDPAAVGRILANQMEQTQVSRYQDNASRALEHSEAVYSTLSDLKAISDRAGELATLGAGATSTDAMTAYAVELDELIQQAVDLANTRFGGDYLLAGTAVDTAPFTAATDADGALTGVTYTGNSDRISIALSATSAISPGTSGETNQAVAAFINRLVGLRDTLETGDTTAVNDLRPGLEESEDMFVNALSSQGAIQTRIEAAQTQLQSRQDQLTGRISADADADVTSTYVSLTTATAAYEAALTSSSAIIGRSLLDYL
ncbi:flagellin/flagellar hook associated protein [Opitutaceae bacterium TAV1]|nr:flagellin/flagellar hook associated protein [Opitutaceae bacterium TAV1]